MSTDSTDARDSDALDALRLPTSAESPSPEFAARLRRRLEDLLRPPPRGGDMTATTMTHVPRATKRSVTVYLAAHDAWAAIDWYQDVLGAALHGDVISMEGGIATRDDKVGHCELWFGDSVVYLSDEWPEGGVFSPRTVDGSVFSLVLDVIDADAVYEHAVERGATALRPVADQPYGFRGGWLTDPFGIRWSIQSPLASAAVHHETEPFVATELWNELGYYTISVPDPERARRFYSGLLGWDLPAPEHSAGGFYGMHNSSTKLPMGFHAPTDEDGPGPVIYFRVHDVEEAAQRVRELGGEVLTINVYASGGGAVCRDDQGVQFHLWQPAEGY